VTHFPTECVTHQELHDHLHTLQHQNLMRSWNLTEVWESSWPTPWNSIANLPIRKLMIKILHYFLNYECSWLYVLPRSLDLSSLDFHLWRPHERKHIRTQSRPKMKIFDAGIHANDFAVLCVITHSIGK
jgi:hypothetical protein